ncbi:MAG: hypothetical protein KME38_28390 [Spirirestis rafaelensis WJT71-NPBG6]|jgi:hypothetical protein|nr:hypothetical protein [Spirirestis rafaelensis WJT71-NPBG6]
MEVYAGNYYTKSGELDEANSGTYVMGLFASIDGIAIVVIKVFSDMRRWDFVAEYVNSNINADISECEIIKFTELYDIQHFLGNDIASSLVNKNSIKNKQGIVTSGWETINLGAEHMLFLVQANIKHLGVTEVLIPGLEYDLRNFDLRDVRLNERHYPRISAIASVIAGAKPTYNRMLFS